MTALSQGFETMGLMAGGTTTDVSPDNIVNNAIQIFSVFWDKAHFNSLGLLVVNCVSLLTMIVLLFLTAIEMFMARVEFYTMAMLVMPLLPFMITSKFSFLSDKAIGAMFNLAIKIVAIAFMTTIIEPFLNGFAQRWPVPRMPGSRSASSSKCCSVRSSSIFWCGRSRNWLPACSTVSHRSAAAA